MFGSSLVLLGDSILDNASYTSPEPDTRDTLSRMLPGCDITLLARDGATMQDLPGQLEQLEGCPEIGVLSIGGNDMTRHIPLLSRDRGSAADLLGELLGIADGFERHYEVAARRAASCVGRLVLCTIYEVQLEPPPAAALVRVPLGVLNDRIFRVASRLGLDVLELRDVCTQPSDFVLQIEPSASGAWKIARAIARLVKEESGLPSGRLFTPARERLA